MADILGAIGGALGLNASNGPAKLRVESWTDIHRSGISDKIFTAYINPDEFTLNYNVYIDNEKSPGEFSNFGNVLGMAPLEITLKFFLDGTGVNGNKIDVPAEIQKFYEAVGYHEKKHSIRYLRIFWGDLTLLRSNQFALECILKNASLQYKLFDTSGKPLRVVITATFTEALSKDIVALEFPKQSPDLTHVRVVKEGDTLPALTSEIYGDFKYYLEIARMNSLEDFRNLPPGLKLFFPPFTKNVIQKENA